MSFIHLLHRERERDRVSGVRTDARAAWWWHIKTESPSSSIQIVVRCIQSPDNNSSEGGLGGDESEEQSEWHFWVNIRQKAKNNVQDKGKIGLLFTFAGEQEKIQDNNWPLIFMCQKNIITIVSYLLIVFFTNVKRLLSRGSQLRCWRRKETNYKNKKSC